MGDEPKPGAPFTISDFETLNALSRALVEAKFHAEPIDPDVPTSPRIAELAMRVADLVEEETARHFPGIHDTIDGWRNPKEQPEMLAVVRKRLREARAWTDWTREEKRAYTGLLLSPLHPAAEVVDALVAERDAQGPG